MEQIELTNYETTLGAVIGSGAPWTRLRGRLANQKCTFTCCGTLYRLCLGGEGHGYPPAVTLPGPCQHHQHGSLHRNVPEPFKDVWRR
jgi:hypothetical protein